MDNFLLMEFLACEEIVEVVVLETPFHFLLNYYALKV
jgi:hypothetical protein